MATELSLSLSLSLSFLSLSLSLSPLFSLLSSLLSLSLSLSLYSLSLSLSRRSVFVCLQTLYLSPLSPPSLSMYTQSSASSQMRKRMACDSLIDVKDDCLMKLISITCFLFVYFNMNIMNL